MGYMRWKKKGYEMDEIAEKLVTRFSQIPRIYIFGAGIKGGELAPILHKYGCLEAYIDNDISKQQQGYKNRKVYSLNEYSKLKNGIIVLSASHKNIPTMEKQLEFFNLRKGEDYFLHEEFCNKIFPILSVYHFNKLYINLAQITLTERCTLKCKKCAHGCFAVDNSTAIDMSVEQVYKSVDSFFSKIDFIKEFVLIGGETLLYKDLHQVIRYIGENYRQQIGIYSITTNGTIIPNENVINACKKYNVWFRISNYTHQLPQLKEKYKKLVEYLAKNDILYVLGKKETQWIDYGFDYLDRKATKDELIKVFDSCHTPCREIRENRFYYCVMARSISENLGYHIGQDDYLDLDKLKGKEYKKELLEFTLGYSEKGYLDMCNHCNGAEARNYPIPAAEQVER